VSASPAVGTPTKMCAADVEPNRRRGGDIRILLGPRTVGATSGFSGVLTLAPGEFVSEHYHPYSEEFLHVVTGALALRLDGPEGPVVELNDGEAFLVPKNLRHRLVNVGTTEAAVIFTLCPLAPRPELGHVDTEPVADPAAPHPGAGTTP
jgi:putative monooxygenase